MDIRKIFLDYFQKNGHLILPSAGLIPENDPSVLLTTAGMQQFKPFYLGIKKPPKSRIATVQKCFRTSDIDSVGYTERHLTFFEMLGNFSFGDYFKEEAIKYSLDFMVNNLMIPIEKLWVGVFSGEGELFADKESEKYWIENGIDQKKIYWFDKKENFWGPAGDTGPCGPCTEIYYDFGEKFGCGKKDCGPGCDCERFLEIWNLVFTQYDYNGSRYIDLPSKNIDTGMGLERIAAVLEGTPSVFKTSLFKEIVEKIKEISGGKLNGSSNSGLIDDYEKSIRIIADHSRAIYFLISDGVVPSNEGRGYILRRIIRRAVRFGRLIGIKDYFLNEIGSTVIDNYSGTYPELLNKKDFSFDLVRDEEERFSKTLKEGMKVLVQNIADLKALNKNFLSPKDSFKLYDTFGFPVELTVEILKENNLDLNLNKFSEFVKKHSEKSRTGASFNKKIDKSIEIYKKIIGKNEVEFLGYHDSNVETKIVNIIKIYNNGEKKSVSSLSEHEKGEIILKKTPFYGEKGGQIGDSGVIKGCSGTFLVEECKIPVDGIYVHTGKMSKGGMSLEKEVKAEINLESRKEISKNHTATHMLHWALRSILGENVMQSGSFVGKDRFRFDYTVYSTPPAEKLEKVERTVNKKIQNNDIVRCFETTKEYADEIGAISLFEEKYGKFVRICEIGDYSRELCGGTHINRTGEIGIFKIISDSSIGANLRRIEAVTGMHAYLYLLKRDKILREISNYLDSDEIKLKDTIISIKKNLQDTEERLSLFQIKAAKKELLNKFRSEPNKSIFNIIDFDFSKADYNFNLDVKSMGMAGDEIRNLFKNKNTFIVLGNIVNGKPVLILQATKDVAGKGINCGKLAKEAGGKMKGGGGGSSNFAQAGGSDAKSLEAAINFVKNKVYKVLNN